MSSLHVACFLSAFLALASRMEAEAPSYPKPWAWQVTPLPIVSASYPQTLSAGAELSIGRSRSLNGFEGQVQGLSLTLEPGVAGISASAGIAILRSNCTGFQGVSLGLSYLHTWGPHWWLNSNENYLGLQAAYYLSVLKFTGGILRRNGAGNSPRTIPLIKASLIIPIE